MEQSTYPLVKFSNFWSMHPYHYMIYVPLYIITGFIFHNIGIFLHIAKFNRNYQIFTCYGLYLIPVSILIRHLDWRYQYLMALFFLGWLELLGYSRLHEIFPNVPFSVALPGNIVDMTLGERNFSLFMTLFLSPLVPALNFIEEWIGSHFLSLETCDAHHEAAQGRMQEKTVSNSENIDDEAVAKHKCMKTLNRMKLKLMKEE